MGPNLYLYEKAREVHYQDLRREVEKRRWIAPQPGPRWSMSRHMAAKLGMLLLKLEKHWATGSGFRKEGTRYDTSSA